MGHHLSYMPPDSCHPQITKRPSFTLFLQVRRCSGSRAEQPGCLVPSVKSSSVLVHVPTFFLPWQLSSVTHPKLGSPMGIL